MKRMPVGLISLLASVCLLLTGCTDTDVPPGGYAVAVTNSYLECAVRDLCGRDLAVLPLVPAGMCPGHFDISPAQVRQLRDCSLLVRFDFQEGIEQRLARLRQGGLEMQPVSPTAGLCVPDTYLAVCRQVFESLSRAYPAKAAEFEERLAAIERRITELASELRTAVADAGIVGADVLTSNHQADFARWLGLEPVATFIGSDIETVANIDHSLRRAAGRDVRFVIANRQEGTALARALADRLGARVVVFGNFPEVYGAESGFDRLVRDNVRLLCEAAAP